jgi:hypothetical protein
MIIVFSFLVNFILFLQKHLGIFGQFFDISKMIFFLKISKKNDTGNFFFSCVISTNFSNHWKKKTRISDIENLKRKKKEKRKALMLILNCE